MSGLAAVLAGRHEPGVYTWQSGLEVSDIRHAVEQAGFGFGYVDGWRAQDKRAVLAGIGEALRFPDHYGGNLDALVDCLRAVDDTVLLWDGWSPLAREDPRSFAAVVEVLAERARRARALVVLLRGDGPETDLPALD